MKKIKKCLFNYSLYGDDCIGDGFDNCEDYAILRINKIIQSEAQKMAGEMVKELIINVFADIDNGIEHNEKNGSSLNDISSIQVEAYLDYWYHNILPINYNDNGKDD